MRLWHESLIAYLPGPQLLGQHRECCALRGRGWGKKHSIVDYVFLHSPMKLFLYHDLVMTEMKNRGYNVDQLWLNPLYRGKTADSHVELPDIKPSAPIYSEHNQQYLSECLNNLAEKNIHFKEFPLSHISDVK